MHKFALYLGRRCARPARREEGTYRQYSTDEQRLWPGCSGGKGTWIDIEGLATFNLLSVFDIFAGYRYISIDTEGDADGQAFEADVELQGWIVGGGISW